MKVTSVSTLDDTTATAVVVGVFAELESAPGSRALLQDYSAILKSFDFEGKSGQVLAIPGENGRKLVMVGLGEELDAEGLRQAAARGLKAASSDDVVATTLHQIEIDGADLAVVGGMAMADYRYEDYKSDAKERPELQLELIGGEPDLAGIDASLVVMEAVKKTRDLVNRPSISKSPMTFAQEFAEAVEKLPISARIVSGDELEKEKLAGLIAVGAGSSRPPCLLKLEYRPKDAKRTLALVGKGIVFDSGGLSIKPADYMYDMKCDMAGAAAVSSAILAIARLGLSVNVVAFAVLAENMTGSHAQRPGDVIRYRNGKTVEVLNTDAEGRLVLADGLCLAAEEKPDLIVDMATLTGACKIALGPSIAGVFGNDRSWVEKVVLSAESAGERMWAMPLPDDHDYMIESDVADMKNISTGRYGGAITAALILSKFVGEVPWVHIDVAGPAYMTKADHYIPKGGSGFGVRTLVELARSLS